MRPGLQPGRLMLAMPIKLTDPGIRASMELGQHLKRVACLSITRDLVCLQLIGSDREEVRCAGPVVVSALEGPSAWRVALRIVSSPPPSGIEVSTAGSARGVDPDEVPGDRIKNGHTAVLSLQAQEERAMPGLDQLRLWVWLRDC
jgi:hypothetical protein